MSKREKPLIEKYWNGIGGTIIYEFPMTEKTETSSARYLDALILPNEDKQVSKAVDIADKEIIIVQAKAKRLGMTVMGQALFSIQLMKKFKPASIRAVILCTKDDDVLHKLLKRRKNIEVIVMPNDKS